MYSTGTTSSSIAITISSGVIVDDPVRAQPAAALNVAQYFTNCGHVLPGQGFAGPWHNDDLMERLTGKRG